MKFKPLGVLRDNINPEVIMMICTAGHVDHGKTSLVKLLTGCNTDRLKEEQERGLTIELGFAPCFLGNNLCVGIVDVPGHEKFIKNMVAGVSGIDMTILVIAADDGIMPQTIEHLQIMELLGVKKGIVALTKIDLVDKERLDSLSNEIKLFLKGTFLEGAKIFPVSSETFVGYPEFYNGLISEIKNLSAVRRKGIFRMPIERSFLIEGIGKIVTGIPVSGTIKVGDTIEILPQKQLGKIRGIQRFLRDSVSGGCGQCLALNIPDFGKIDIQRGNVISIPNYLQPANIFHLKFKTVQGLKELIKNSEQIKFHTGTIEKNGKIYLLDENSPESEKGPFAAIVISEPVAAAIGDRVIIRRTSPNETIAGGEIISISYTQNRPAKNVILPKLKKYVEFTKNISPESKEFFEKKIEYLLLYEFNKGTSIKVLSQTLLLEVDEIKSIVDSLKNKDIVKTFSDDFIIHVQNLSKIINEVENEIIKISKDENTLSISVLQMHNKIELHPNLWDIIDTELEKKKILKKTDNKYILCSSQSTIAARENQSLMQILKILEQTAFSTPRPDELSLKLKIPEPKINNLLEHLSNENKIVKISKNVFLTKENLKKAQDIVIKTIKEKGSLDSADFKYLINSTRKYALAILDFLDFKGVTMRIDNIRKLTKDYEKKII